jgi:heme exporter protein D
MNTLFGTKYFGFIFSAYGITAVVLLGLLIWIVATYRGRRRQLAKLEAAGIKRASRTHG